MSKKRTPRQEWREKHEIRWNALEEHLDKLLDLARTVRAGDRILLVGRNGTGKSLFRSLIHRDSRKLKCTKTDPLLIVHASMALRTGSFPHMGGLGSMLHDREGEATSNASVHLIRGAFRTVKARMEEKGKCGIHLDEPEVGCSEELQLSLSPWIRKQIDKLKPTLAMLTTHSKTMAQNFKDWKLVDTGFEFKSVDAWLNREIKPMDFEELALDAHTLYLVITDRIERRQEKK